jgi:hypothetical protein
MGLSWGCKAAGTSECGRPARSLQDLLQARDRICANAADLDHFPGFLSAAVGAAAVEWYLEEETQVTRLGGHDQ